MVTITNGRMTHSVTIGAYNAIYKDKGFRIVGKKPNREVKIEEVVKNTDIQGVQNINPVKEMAEAEESEADWVTELLEKPISQWSKEETANFAKEKDIDTSNARKLSEAKDIIKEWLDEQNK